MGKHHTRSQRGKDNPSYKDGLSAKKRVLCSFCGKETTTPGYCKRGFCNRKCRSLWQSINYKGKNNPAYGIKRPDLAKRGRVHIWTREERERNRKRTILQHINGEFNYFDTKPERMVENWLLFHNVLYVKQHVYGMGIADFWLPEDNTIIEVDGDYWHSLPKNIKKDRIQTDWLENHDYIVYRIKEKDVYSNLNECMRWMIDKQ
jgi:very-short-patch-repair endonuclease